MNTRNSDDGWFKLILNVGILITIEAVQTKTRNDMIGVLKPYVVLPEKMIITLLDL